MIDRDQAVLLTLKTVKKWREEIFNPCFNEMKYVRYENHEKEQHMFSAENSKFIPVYDQAFNEVCAQYVLLYFQSDNGCDLDAREHILNDSVAMQWNNYGFYSLFMRETKDREINKLIDVKQFSEIVATLLDGVLEQSNNMIKLMDGSEYINITTDTTETMAQPIIHTTTTRGAT